MRRKSKIFEYAKTMIEHLGGVPNLDNPNLFSIKSDLVIRHKDSRIEYTIEKVDLSDVKNPTIFAFRYTPDRIKKHITINKKEFKEYENI